MNQGRGQLSKTRRARRGSRTELNLQPFCPEAVPYRFIAKALRKEVDESAGLGREVTVRGVKRVHPLFWLREVVEHGLEPTGVDVRTDEESRQDRDAPAAESGRPENVAGHRQLNGLGMGRWVRAGYADCSLLPVSPPSLSSGSDQLCGLAHFRFPLSLRMVEEMLAARGICVTYETVRQWGKKFGKAFADQIRVRAPGRGDKWHMDEVVVSIARETHWLWRAV